MYISVVNGFLDDIPSAGFALGRRGEFELHAVDTIDGVNEQDEDEDERDLNVR